jgi:hypothetical protein
MKNPLITIKIIKMRIYSILGRYFFRYGAVVGYFYYVISIFLQLEKIRIRKRSLEKFKMDDYELKILESIKINGYAIVKGKDFYGFNEAAEILKEAADEFSSKTLERPIGERNMKSTKSHWIDIFPSDENQRNTIYKFLFSRRVIAIVGHYLREYPYMEYVAYFYSKVGLSNKDENSQMWHKDRDQYNKIKIFYSPFGMDESNGCTKLFLHNVGKYTLYPGYPWHFSDADAAAEGWPLEKTISITLTPEDVAIVDTGLLVHKGSDNISRDRMLMIASYGASPSRLSVSGWRKIQGNSINVGEKSSV